MRFYFCSVFIVLFVLFPSCGDMGWEGTSLGYSISGILPVPRRQPGLKKEWVGGANTDSAAWRGNLGATSRGYMDLGKTRQIQGEGQNGSQRDFLRRSALCITVQSFMSAMEVVRRIRGMN